MRYVTSLLAVSTLILAIICVYLHQQLEAAREIGRRNEASESEQSGQLARLEQIRATFATALRAPNSAQPEAPTAPPVASGTPSAGAPRAPEMTDEQRLALTHRRYRRIFTELGLSNADVAAILPVLVQQDLRANKPLPQQEPQRVQAELAAILGAQKADHFTALRKLQPARSEVSMLRLRLDDSGHPLSDDQAEALVGVLASKSTEPAPQRIAGVEPPPTMEQIDVSMRERDQRLRRDAASVLTAPQLQVLEQDDAFRDVMRTRMAAIGIPQAGSSGPAARIP